MDTGNRASGPVTSPAATLSPDDDYGVPYTRAGTSARGPSSALKSMVDRLEFSFSPKRRLNARYLKLDRVLTHGPRDLLDDTL